jgi:hypothetical protein
MAPQMGRFDIDRTWQAQQTQQRRSRAGAGLLGRDIKISLGKRVRAVHPTCPLFQ